MTPSVIISARAVLLVERISVLVNKSEMSKWIWWQAYPSQTSAGAQPYSCPRA